MSFVAVTLPIVIGVGGALIEKKGAEDAADTLAGGALTAAQLADRADQRAREDLQPFRDIGGGIAPLLSEFVREGPETELERTQGFTDIQKSAAAGGKGLRSGNTLKGLTQFNNLLNSRNRQQRFNELFNVVTLGANAASRTATNTLNSSITQGGFLTDAASATAAGQIGASNAIVNGLQNLSFLNFSTKNKTSGQARA